MNFYPKEINNREYYKSKMPMYLQGSYGFVDEFYIYTDLLKAMVEAGDDVLASLDIFNENYKNINSDILDKLAYLFNIKRKFKYKGIEFNLTDDDLLLYIKSRIIKGTSDASYKQMIEFYHKAGLNVFMHFLDSGYVRLYLLNLTNEYSDNITNLFECGLLTIHNLGINYDWLHIMYDEIGIFGVSKFDDEKRFGI